jgi:hypothetical protein
VPEQVIHFDGLNKVRSNLSVHSSAPDPPPSALMPTGGRYPFVELIDLFIDGALRIRKRRGLGTAIGTLPAACVALHEFERVDPVTGLAVLTQFAATATEIHLWDGAAFGIVPVLPFVPTGSYWQFLNFENRCFVVNGKDQMIVFDQDFILGPWHLVGQVAPAAVLTYALGGVYQIGTLSATVNTKGITGVVPAIWTGMDGKLIDINGIRYTIDTITVNGNGATIAPQANLVETFKEVTAGGMTYVIHNGVMSWHNPPRYGASYFNPVTGHSSDIGPILQLTEKEQTSVTPTVTLAGTGNPLTDPNAKAYNAGYTQIAFFRSFLEGTTMAQISTVVNNRNDGGNIVFTETAVTGKNTALTNNIAPQDTNKKPPVGIAAIAAWMGRIFGLLLADPTAADRPGLYFTPIREEVTFGVAEECWPRRYVRHGVDRPKSVISVGNDTLANGVVIPSSNGDWTFEGYDNFTFTPPHRIGTRQSGGFMFGAIDVGGELVQLYADKRIMHGDTDIGEPVQDKFNSLLAQYLTGTRLIRFSYENSSYLLISATKTGAVNNYTLVFNYDRGAFYEWRVGFTAFAAVHNTTTNALELWAGTSTGKVYKLLQDGVFVDDAATQYQPSFRTAPIRFATRKLTRRVHIFVNGAGGAAAIAALTWQLNYRLDKDVTNSGAGATVRFLSPTTGRQSEDGELVYEFGHQPTTWNVSDYRVIYPATNGDLYVEKMLIVIDDEQEDGTTS